MELGILINSGAVEDPSDVLIFLGRFHPLVVHLPIGFLFLAVLAQFSTRWPKFRPIAPFVHYLWGLGALSAFLAVVLGYMLSLTGDYDEDALFWHQWSGVAVLLSALGCYYIFKRGIDIPSFTRWILVFLVFASVVYTGHLGGHLTHGSTYLLEYAPNPLRNLAGMPSKAERRKKVTELDSADIFLDVVAPILNSRCTSCHNNGKKKGGLILTTYDNIIKGGENGEVIISGDAGASELLRRITLPEDHEDFMPTDGKRRLSNQEVDLIEWWIVTGALPSGYVTRLEPGKEIVGTVENYLGLDQNKLLGKVILPPDKAVMDSLRNYGFVLNRLMKDNYFLEANFSLSERELTTSDLDLLLRLKEQLIWLDLSNSRVKDNHLEKIGQLENLMKLNLSGNDITDEGMEQLATLENLEYLNLYGTDVSEGLLSTVPQLPALKKIYLWQTEVSDSIAAQLQTENKDITVVYDREEGLNSEVKQPNNR